jgi:hypothetical protein
MAANPNTPYGLQPVNRLGNAEFRNSVSLYYVPAAKTNAIYVGDPVLKVTASADANGVDGCDLAAATGNITGVVVGFLGVCASGAAAPAFFGLSATPGPAYRPASTAQDYYVLVNDDPQTVYAVQSNDSGGAPAATKVGQNANLVVGTGSAYTGLSGWMLAANSINTTNTLQVNIVGFLRSADNVAGQSNAKLLVRLNTSTEVNGATGI